MTSFKKYDGDILGIAGTPFPVDVPHSLFLDNPCPSYVQAFFEEAGNKVVLPQMNLPTSLRLGQTIVIENVGFIGFDIYAADATTEVYNNVPPGQSLSITVKDNSTALGSFMFPISKNPQKMILEGVTSLYQVDASKDWGKVFTSNSGGGSLVLTARSNYKPGFFFSYKINGPYINNITPHAGDTIDNLATYSVQQNGSVVIFNNNISGCWSILDEKVGGFNSTTGQYEIPSLNILPLQSTLSDYIVGATQSNYTTIQAAINAAVANGASTTNIKQILVKPGTYIENITLSSGIVIRGMDALCWSGIYFQSVAQQITAAKLVGTVTYNTSAVAAATYCSMQNIWITPTTGNAITHTGTSSTQNQLLFLQGCRIETTSASSYCLNLTNCTSTFDQCLFNDNTSGTTGHFYNVAGDGNTAFITCTNTLIQTDYGSTAAPLTSGSVPSVRLVNCTSAASVDATNCTTYNFRAENLTHISFATNLTPYHVTGASTAGRIIYDNCQVTVNDTNLNIATIGSSAYVIEFNNTNFGNIQVPSSTKISGGRQILTNCAFQTGTSTYYVRNDMIKIGYSGASKISSQAGVTTTDATVTTLDSILVNEGESVTVTGTITAQKNNSLDACGGNFLITASRGTGI